MSEIKGRMTITRYANNENKKLLDYQNFWYFSITRLYSGVNYSDGEYKPNIFSPLENWTYDSKKPVYPMFNSTFVQNPSSTRIYTYCKFFIAVKELIIEWKDYQAEVAAYVHCNACDDVMDQSQWFNRPNKEENQNDSRQLIRFVKSPGLKTTNIKIDKEQLDFFPIQLEKCSVVSKIFDEIKLHKGKNLQIRREHELKCEIRSLFDDKQSLPIKHAHITVEIYLQ